MVKARLALACSVVLFAFVAGCIALPDMAFARLFLWVRGASEEALRKSSATRSVKWGARVSRWIGRIMQIRIVLDLPQEDDGRPAIVISNHTSTYEIIALLEVLAVTGRYDVRWVLKEEVLKAPVIGIMAKWVGCIPVARNRNPADRERVRKGGEQIGQEGASPLIFPEGTRFDPRKLRVEDGFRHVLAPKRGGFDQLREALPDYPVFDMTLDWRPVVPPGEGKTMWSAIHLYGRELHVSVELVEPTELRDRDWIVCTFRKKDAYLAKARM